MKKYERLNFKIVTWNGDIVMLSNEALNETDTMFDVKEFFD